jgi:hypothetical protein
MPKSQNWLVETAVKESGWNPVLLLRVEVVVDDWLTWVVEDGLDVLVTFAA